MENEGLFNKSKKYGYPMSRLFYTLIIVLGASKEALAAFSNPREALKVVF